MFLPGQHPTPNLKNGHWAKAYKAKGLNESSFRDSCPQEKQQRFPLPVLALPLFLSLSISLANKRDIRDRGCCHLKAVTLPVLLIINLTSVRIEGEKALVRVLGFSHPYPEQSLP